MPCAARWAPVLASLLVAAPALDATPSLELEPCHVRGISRQVLCGALEVPEDRTDPTAAGRRLTLSTVVVPAITPREDAEPIYLLAGGPGQAATAIVPLVVGPLADLNRNHDLVFVDQRGSGSGSPMRCFDSPREGDVGSGDTANEEPGGLEARFLEPDLEKELRRCLDGLDADPRLYTTPIAMDDLDDARRALGHDRIHLWGGSYGTRAALVYLDRHGANVVSAVLDGAAPVQMALPAQMAVDAERALDLLFADCAADSGCAAAFPDLRGSLAAAVQRLRARLEADPEARFEVRDPLTGDPTSLRITPESFPSLLRAVLYDVTASRLLPFVIEEAAQGRFEPFVALAWQAAGNEGAAALSPGLFLSVVCAEDRRLVDPAEARRDAAATFLGSRLVEVLEEACTLWPAGEVPEDYFRPVESEVPVLVLSGELDPVTPPRWGEAVARSLPRARHVVVPATGHGTLSHGCVPDLVTGFVRSDGAEVPETTCLERLRRPRFFVDRLGPSTGVAHGSETAPPADPDSGDAPDPGGASAATGPGGEEDP